VASASENQCGDRIHLEDVLVLDLEEFVGQQELFEQKLHQQAGDTVLITAAPLKVSWAGNRAATINTASKSAAQQGCDLLVLLGESITERRYEGGVRPTRYLVIHMGKREHRNP
jgi:hypothetical protein